MGQQRMSYTLAGAAQATGLDESTILRAIEDGRMTGTKDLFGAWQVEDGELYRLNAPIAAPDAHRDAAPAGATPEATTLEAEMGALLREAGDTLREQGDGGHAESRSGTDHDIRLLDRDKILLPVSPPRLPRRRAALIAGALLTTLGIGWAGGLSSHHLLWGAAPLEQKLSSSARISGSENQTAACVSPDKAARVAVSGRANAGKIATATGSGIARRHESTQSIARPATSATNKTSPALQRNATAAETAATIGRRANTLSTPMPVPETKPTTIEGWTVREVVDGTAVLEGPDGVWKAARGEVVPGLGRVDSIVRWGNRWIVATSKGLITTE
jgi:hypothetical protein